MLRSALLGSFDVVIGFFSGAFLLASPLFVGWKGEPNVSATVLSAPNKGLKHRNYSVMFCSVCNKVKVKISDSFTLK